MARSCIFCGASDVTSEHAWPDWLGRRFDNASTVVERTGREPLWFTGRVFDLRVRVVCGKCNHGWLA